MNTGHRHLLNASESPVLGDVLGWVQIQECQQSIRTGINGRNDNQVIGVSREEGRSDLSSCSLEDS